MKTIEKKQRRKARTSYKVKLLNKSKLPRLSVFKSHANLHAQLIDDTKSITILCCPSLQKHIKSQFNELAKPYNIQGAKIIGKEIAKLCLKSGIKKIVFDKGSSKYTGRIKALCDEARSNGLEF